MSLRPHGAVAGVLYRSPTTGELLVQVGRYRNGGVDVCRRLSAAPDPADWDTVAEGEPVGEDAALRIPEDVARALLDALAEHFGGDSVGRTARQDHVAERARVDKLTDALIAVVTR